MGRIRELEEGVVMAYFRAHLSESYNGLVPVVMIVEGSRDVLSREQIVVVLGRLVEQGRIEQYDEVGWYYRLVRRKK